MGNVPYLCGGTFFLLLLQAKEKWEKVAGVRKTDRVSNVSVFKGLLSLFRFTNTFGFSDNTLEGATSDYRACKGNSTVNSLLPSPNSNSDIILKKYSNNIHSAYELALKDMEFFVAEKLNLKASDNDNKGDLHIIQEWLVKALLEVLANDVSIKDNQLFFASEDGSAVTKKELLQGNSYYLPSLLLGVWYYILKNRPNNEQGRATFEAWTKQEGGPKSQWIFISNVGYTYSRNIKLYDSLEEAQAARAEERNRLEEKKASERRETESFFGPLPEVFSNFPPPKVSKTRKDLAWAQRNEPLFSADILRDKYEWHDLYWCLTASKHGYKMAQCNWIWMCAISDLIPQDFGSSIANWFREAAEKGFSMAQFYLGILYQYGKFVAQDYDEAIDWYRQAAQQGYAMAECNLGWMYSKGCGVDHSNEMAVKWYRKAAERGYAMAQFHLGWMYANGHGVNQDYQQAMHWYYEAAKQGYAIAQYNLGLMYANEDGVLQDYKQAATWYQCAAEQGYAKAQCNLGWIYQVAHSDIRQAENWYIKAAEQGNAVAQYNLGLIYQYGQSGVQDYMKASDWYRKAAGQGYVDAQVTLGLMYQNGQGVAQDDRKAMDWYQKAYFNGSVIAENYLGWMYANGRGVDKDEKYALKLFRRAAEQGCAEAQYNLGCAYANGSGVDRDIQQAIDCFLKAGNQEYAIAQYVLGQMYELGQGIDRNVRQAISWYRKAAKNGVSQALDALRKFDATGGSANIPRNVGVVIPMPQAEKYPEIAKQPFLETNFIKKYCPDAELKTSQSPSTSKKNEDDMADEGKRVHEDF